MFPNGVLIYFASIPRCRPGDCEVIRRTECTLDRFVLDLRG